jgi:HemY protein
MRFWIAIIALLALAVAAAFGWQWIADDPGQVLVRLRGISIETSVVFALVSTLVLVALVSILWRLVRWPWRGWRERRRRRGRTRLENGLVALAEGRNADAERQLAKVARHDSLRTPALLAQAQAAHARGAEAEAETALDAASARAEPAALALRARFLLEQGRADEALALLRPRADAGSLAPVGWRVLVDAALATGDTATARTALTPLLRSASLGEPARDAIENRVLGASLAAATDSARLDAEWSGLSRAQRRRPQLVEAYARRAAALGQILPAMDAIESAQRREWSDALATCYSELGPAELGARTRSAESWLKLAPGSAALLVALGRLCRDQGLWGKATEYLERALATDENADAWEVLGDCRLAEDASADAARCYANALHLRRGEPTAALAGTGKSIDPSRRALVFDQRNAHGLPQLPAS